MKLLLHKIEAEHFKGLGHFEAAFNGADAQIVSENGVGKTTVYDAFLWVLFGKDSTGRKEFAVWPLDDRNQPLHDVTLAVRVTLEVDGQTRVLRRELEQKVSKGGRVSYPTACWIDEVPKKVGEFDDFIASILPEATFKMLTDLAHVNTKLSWQDRRRLLLELAGPIDPPKGFGGLLSRLNGRTIEEYRKVLAEQKKRHETERDGVPPRIDELQRGLADYVPGDTLPLKSKRSSIQSAIGALDAERNGLLDAEKQRQKTLNDLNCYEVQRRRREIDIQNDMSAVDDLLKEKTGLMMTLSDAEETYNQMVRQKTSLDETVQQAKAKHEQALQAVQAVRQEIQEIEQAKDPDTCYACGQQLPAEKIEQAQKERQAKISELQKTAAKKKEVAESCETVYRDALAERDAHSDKKQKTYRGLEALRTTTKSRLAKIAEAIENRPTPDPKEDAVWRQITENIERLQSELGEPVADQLTQIEERRRRAEQELAEVNKALANDDRAAKDRQRIAELTEQEKDLSQKIADCDKQIDEIKRFNLEIARRTQAAVNGQFKHVTWKLFDHYLNGEINDQMCTALYNGVPYPDLSAGQQIFVGVDIINVLSRHYGFSVPLFVDHAESLTLPLETEAQVIRLVAQVGVKQLQLEIFLPVDQKAVA